jgi:collagen type VI alpha
VAARNAGTFIVTFAVGTDVNVFELRNIASEPYAKTIFSVDSWTQLPTLQQGLISATCDSVNQCSPNPCQNGGSCQRSMQNYQCTCPAPYSGLVCDRRCPAQLDVTFVLDLSGSLEEVYNIVIQVAKQAIYGLPIGQTRVAVITFADNPSISFDLATYTTPAQIRNALAFSQAGGVTNTQAAINLAYNTGFTAPRGDRPGVKNVMVVVTDGNSNVQQQNTVPEANNARQRGIEVFAVGIGPEVNPTEISAIASAPTAGHVVYVWNATDASAGASKLLDLLCQL